MSGTYQEIKVDSVPPGATVTTGWESNVDGKVVMTGRSVAGVTPITVSIPRKDGMIEVAKDGYKTQNVQLERELNYWFLGNVVLTSLLSSSIDTSTGAISEYRPGQFMINLEPIAKAN